MVKLRRLFIIAVLVMAVPGVLLTRWYTGAPNGDGDSAKPPPRVMDRVQPGVTMLGHDLSGLSHDELRAWLAEKSRTWRRDPVDARLDPVTGGVIPHLDGFRLDVDATMEILLTSPPGAVVQPQIRWLPASTTMEDFPTAPLYSANPDPPGVAFLVNVAWGNEELVAMLEIFAAEKVRTTFFLVGRWVDANPDLARLIARHGHEIASHGYSDAISIGAADAAAARADLERAHQSITRIGAGPIRFFSPHRGELSPVLLEVAGGMGYRLVMWSVDTIDWQDPAKQVLLDRVLSKVEPGSLILMHPRRVTVEALPELIHRLRAAGLPPVTLSELVDPRRLPEF